MPDEDSKETAVKARKEDANIKNERYKFAK